MLLDHFQSIGIDYQQPARCFLVESEGLACRACFDLSSAQQMTLVVACRQKSDGGFGSPTTCSELRSTAIDPVGAIVYLRPNPERGQPFEDARILHKRIDLDMPRWVIDGGHCVFAGMNHERPASRCVPHHRVVKVVEEGVCRIFETHREVIEEDVGYRLTEVHIEHH